MATRPGPAVASAPRMKSWTSLKARCKKRWEKNKTFEVAKTGEVGDVHLDDSRVEKDAGCLKRSFVSGSVHRRRKDTLEGRTYQRWRPGLR